MPNISSVQIDIARVLNEYVEGYNIYIDEFELQGEREYLPEVTALEVAWLFKTGYSNKIPKIVKAMKGDSQLGNLRLEEQDVLYFLVTEEVNRPCCHCGEGRMRALLQPETNFGACTKTECINAVIDRIL